MVTGATKTPASLLLLLAMGAWMGALASPQRAFGTEPAPTSGPAPDAPPPPPSVTVVEPDAEAQAARDAFLRGAALVEKAKWPEALAAFERADAIRRHAVTTFNMAICLRAMGRFIQARKQFQEALALDDAAERTQLSTTLRDEIDAILAELDGALARARIKLAPANAAIAIDGRPLELQSAGEVPVLVAGTEKKGRGKAPPKARFDVLLDPGAHVITLSRSGYRDAVVNESFEPGQSRDLDLTIARLPASVLIDADPDGAIVIVDGREVGPTPRTLERRAGTYHVVVEKDGYVPYEQSISLRPGQHVDIRAELPIDEPGIHQRWWFWASLVGAAASVAVTTFVVARPEGERPPPDCGTLGWCIDAP